MEKLRYVYRYLSIVLAILLLVITFSCEKEETLIIEAIPQIQISLKTDNSKIVYPDTFDSRIDIEIVDGNTIYDTISFTKHSNTLHRAVGNIEVPVNKRFVLKLHTNIDDTELYSISDTLEIDNDSDAVHSVKMTFTSGSIVINDPTVTSISTTTAVFSSEITDDGGYDIESKGFVITQGGPTASPDDEIVVGGDVLGEFNANVNGLVAGETYTVAAYAEYEGGRILSGETEFTTPTTTGVVSILANPATSIGPLSAVVSATFVDDGGKVFIEKGFVWATSSNPDILTNEGESSEGSGSEDFSTTITGIFESTTYYVVAYAKEEGGEVFYSNEITFSTPSFISPNVETVIYRDVLMHTAVFEGNVTDEGNMPVDSKGVVYSTSSEPTIETNLGVTDAGSGPGIFETTIFGLETGTTYYARTYASSEAGTSYGAEISFTTMEIGGYGPAGGIIFYDDGVSGGLEVTIVDYEIIMQWGCGTSLVNAIQSVVGSGLENTNAIVDYHIGVLVDYAGNPTQCDASNDGTVAAIYCDEFVLNDYDDWFLPSVDEVMLIYSNIHSQGLGDFTDDMYWTSTEVDAIRAKSIDMWKGMEIDGTKITSYKVRPVRKF